MEFAAGGEKSVTQTRDKNRAVSIHRCTVAQLAVAVKAPGPDHPVALDREAVEHARPDAHHADQTRELNRAMPLVRRSVAQLTLTIVSPDPDCPVALDCQ